MHISMKYCSGTEIFFMDLEGGQNGVWYGSTAEDYPVAQPALQGVLLPGDGGPVGGQPGERDIFFGEKIQI